MPGPHLKPLAAYGIDARHGFLPAEEPLKKLPAGYEVWDALVAELPLLLRSAKLRAAVRAMPELEFGAEHSAPAQERALLVLTVLGNAWVWSPPAANFRIPRNLARPLWAVSQRLERPAIVHFAGMNLNNWRKITAGEPLSVDNATTQLQFLGGVDEDWFYIATTGVELAGAPMLPHVSGAVAASLSGEASVVAQHLVAIAEIMLSVQAALARMREWCEPHAFYTRVRPWLAGWPAPGVVYEGVSETPVQYMGGSAGQSSLIQSLDALLGIEHTAASGYLKMIRAYMPVGHRSFVLDVERLSKVRALCQASGGEAAKAYDAALAQVDKFRRMHMGLAQDYISKPSGQPSVAGTGGTDFAEFLRDARLTTVRAHIEKPLL